MSSRRPRPPDDKLTTLLASLPPSSTYFSLEFFPPKTQAGFANLQARLTRMTTAFRPLFVTVTWGAGGSTSTKSLELAEICQRQLGVPTVLHLTCTNMTQSIIDEALEECRSAGIRNVLALRGDPPREEYKDPVTDSSPNHTPAEEEEFVWAVDLVKYIRRKHGDYFCIGVAGYPEGHADESHPEAGKQNVERDLPFLAEKTKAGADFIMTQLTYDADAYSRYEKRLREYADKESKAEIFKTIPIIPGLMPIQSYQIVRRITKLSHAKVPEDISARIEAVKNDDEQVKQVGVDIISELVGKIRDLPQPTDLPRGLHFYTLNLEKSVAYILERCGLLPSPQGQDSSTTSDDSDVAVDGTDMPAQPVTTGTQPTDKSQRQFRRRASSVNAQPHNRVIVDRTKSPPVPEDSEDKTQAPTLTTRHSVADPGSGVPASKATRTQNLLISEGQGSLGREATWDDFPNGRWGPSHSPAFGEIDGYGPSLKVGPITARKLWGYPKSKEDITTLFRRHVNNDLHSVPWSDDVDADAPSNTGEGALRAETEVIKKELSALIEKGYWTLASQPAVDGVRSDHPVFGWGPKGEGFVFQKAFVEFFCPRDVWPAVKQKLIDASEEDFSWMAVDHNGTFESTDTVSDSRKAKGHDASSKRTPGTSGVNAVTWGVFRGKEIATPTIIEAESFQAWADEAYSIWAEWRRCFPRGSEEEKCLDRCRQDVVLVNVVGQRYVREEERLLWKFLLED